MNRASREAGEPMLHSAVPSGLFRDPPCLLSRTLRRGGKKRDLRVFHLFTGQESGPRARRLYFIEGHRRQENIYWVGRGQIRFW